MWLWRLAFAALQALLVFSYHRLRLLQSQLGEPDSQTSSSHVNAHSALERSRESSKTVDLIVKVTGDFSVQLFWTDFEGSEVFYGTVLPGRARPMQLRTFMKAQHEDQTAAWSWRLCIAETGPALRASLPSMRDTDIVDFMRAEGASHTQASRWPRAARTWQGPQILPATDPNTFSCCSCKPTLDTYTSQAPFMQTHPWRLYHSKTGVLLAHFVYTESATVWQAHSPLAETVQISVGSAPAVPWWNLWAICDDQAMHQHCTIAMELLSALVLGAGQGLMCVLAMAAGGRGGHHLLKLARAVL